MEVGADGDEVVPTAVVQCKTKLRGPKKVSRLKRFKLTAHQFRIKNLVAPPQGALSQKVLPPREAQGPPGS